VSTPSKSPTSPTRRRFLAALAVGAALISTPLVAASPAQAVSSRDFSVRLSPASAVISPGGTTSMNIVVTRGRRFRSALSYRVEAPFNGVAVQTTFSSSRASIRFTAAPSAPAAIGSVRVIVSGGGRTRVANGSLQVAGAPVGQPTTPAPQAPVAGDFSITLDQPSITVNAGATVERVVFVTSSGGYTGSPRFEAIGLPDGVVASFNPTSSRVGTTMRLTASATVARGDFPIVVRGIDGDRVRQASGVVRTQFFGPFTMSAAFEPAQAIPGGATVLKVNVGPSGSTLIPDVDLSFLGMPVGTTVTSAGPRVNGVYTYNVVFASTTIQADYPVQIRGQSGSIVLTVPLTLRISAKPALSLAATSLTINKGGVATTEITGGTIAGLPAPAYLVQGVIPGGSTTVFIAVDKRVFVQVATSAATPSGTYNFTVSANNGLGVTTVPFTVTVG
jgi:hypothetical protein